MSADVVLAGLAAAVAAGTAIALGALGALLNERAGVLNLGIEGIMLIGAVTAFLAADGTGNPWIGLVAGMVAGAALASVHGFLAVTLRANQIVSSLALVIFGTGLSTFIGQPIEGDPLDARITAVHIPLLNDIPAVGRVLFRQNPLVYATWVAVVVIAVYLFRTRAGLATRAVGENPATADAMGISVTGVRYAHVALGGLLAGAGGAYQVLVRVDVWSQAATTNGIGWIALAVVVFASWRPLRVLAGAYLFGAALRANFVLQASGVQDIPAEFLAMLPYVLTIAVLILLSSSNARRRLGAPAALGTAFVRDER
ncbi:MAG: ABC transporter permease [Acidimicrobiales bacterium]